VHLLYIVEFENRVLISIQWAWNYLTFNRKARLITGSDRLPQLVRVEQRFLQPSGPATAKAATGGAATPLRAEDLQPVRTNGKVSPPSSQGDA
jgi:hypothetical protein